MESLRSFVFKQTVNPRFGCEGRNGFSVYVLRLAERPHTETVNSQAKRIAPGGPEIEPRWTRGAKLAVGTPCSTSSRIWYTHDSGCVTEVYYPTIDTPRIHDGQLLIQSSQFTTGMFDIRASARRLKSGQVQMVEAGSILRRQANSPFLLYWTKDDWRRSTDTPSRRTAMGIDYADITMPNDAVSLQFTFLWVDEDRWEDKHYKVQVNASAQTRRKVRL